MIRGTTESNSCLKIILGTENDPDTAKHRGRRREGSCEGVGRRNINETGEKEKYWADVMLQMLKAEVHVSGSECT